VEIAEKYLGMKVEERPIRLDEVDTFVEAGACGTAAIITPIGGIFYNKKMHTFFGDGKEVGPVVKKLYDTLIGIQRGELDAPEGWLVEVK
jgi:branched-chain amino acid aminotransferase